MVRFNQASHVQGDAPINFRATLLASTVLASSSLAQAVSFDQIFTPVLATHHVVQVEISPDGQHVVWVESKVKNDDEFDRALYVTEVKPGTVPRMVGPGDPRAQYGMSTVTWSPDSKEFAYVVPAGSSDRSELRIAAAAGTGSRLLATFESQVTAPRWSADGSTIAVLATEEGEAGNEEARVVRIGKHYRRQRVALVDT